LIDTIRESLHSAVLEASPLRGSKNTTLQRVLPISRPNHANDDAPSKKFWIRRREKMLG